MKVRSILVVLSLLAILSTSVGGYLYYASLQESALEEVERQTVNRALDLRNHLSAYLLENLKAVRVMAGLEAFRDALEYPERPDALAAANRLVDHFQWALRADVCYLLDRRGTTLASSNRDEPLSFVGRNYAFRPYFTRAIQGETAVYMALGVTSGKRGVYYSHPVYGSGPFGGPIGVTVVKATIEPVEKEFSRSEGGVVVLADPNGVVFASSRKDWLFHTLWDLPRAKREEIASSRQFGEGQLSWVGLEKPEPRRAVDREGNRYLLHRIDVPEHPGWHVLYLNSLDLFLERVSHPLIRISGIVILMLCLIVGGGVFVLYRKASYEITQRRRAEEALRQSEETARALVNAPTDSALLLDAEGRVLAANESAVRAFRTSTQDFVGSCIFDRFRPPTAARERRRLEGVLRSRRPLRYEDRRGDRFFDTHLYPVFDAEGRVVRVAIFSLDITEIKKTEEELRRTQEELSLYSRDLERQVRQRTREITSILENTPAVVYIKDRNYRYVMVGSRFEKLFGLQGRDVREKTDYEIFPKAIADQFRANDEKVGREQDSIQVEEQVPQEDGVHTYLSVKFPLNDEMGRIRAMCGISTDITELKKAQNQLRRLSGRIMDSQEQERALIARELHDELGQLLTALRMDAVWLREHLGREGRDDASGRATAMCGLIDRTIDEVRGIAIRLRPGVLDDLGLIDALEWYTEEFDRRSETACLFRHRGVPPVKDLIATAAYRIAQEAMTNVARHADAAHVDVSLVTESGSLVLEVVDDGKGFDTARLSETDCLGVAGMRERASLVGGNLKIRARPGGGTRVRFRVPLDGKQGRRHS